MNVIIHDLEKENFQALFYNINADTCIISNNGKIRNCIVQIKWERHYSKSEWTAFLGNY